MSDWPFVEYRTLSSSERSAFSMGPFGSKITKENYVAAGVPVVRGVNLARGIFVDDDFVFIDQEKADELIAANVKPGDLIFTHRGTIGQVSMLPRKPRFDRYVIGSSQVKTRLDESVALPEFYYYWFMSPEGQRSILANTSTVGVPGIATPLTSIKGLRVPLPPFSVQQALAAVLGALDDKIAVNDRVAECSLALADAHFDLAVKGLPTGPETFGSIAQVGGGGTPSTKVPEYWEGTIPWATPSDVTALGAPYLLGTSRRITVAGLDNCASVLYPAGSIFMTSRATIGAFAIPQVPMAVNQGFIVVVTRDEELMMWLFHEMKDRVGEMRSLANGSTFLELSRKNFKAMAVRLPPSTALKEFAAKVIPLHQVAAAATAESATLIKLRDTLLPELMSGRLRVRDAEKVVREAV
ncbi:restriction endonuclease subunit S [Micromonospora sp. NPDC049051]|uniref:restriction endonuclease subunit S n=1 Tax=Micromonospora sp. NPDC049051 TaxID=3364264 RepID=UPI003717E4E0